MNCVKCGTWNPDDKRVCWRCQAELPKPVEKKSKQSVTLLGLPIWSWAIIAAMIVLLLAGQCIAPLISSGG